MKETNQIFSLDQHWKVPFSNEIITIQRVPDRVLKDDYSFTVYQAWKSSWLYPILRASDLTVSNLGSSPLPKTCHSHFNFSLLSSVFIPFFFVGSSSFSPGARERTSGNMFKTGLLHSYPCFQVKVLQWWKRSQ